MKFESNLNLAISLLKRKEIQLKIVGEEMVTWVYFL